MSRRITNSWLALVIFGALALSACEGKEGGSGQYWEKNFLSKESCISWYSSKAMFGDAREWCTFGK